MPENLRISKQRKRVIMQDEMQNDDTITEEETEDSDLDLDKDEDEDEEDDEESDM